jgi:hypothetical protein
MNDSIYINKMLLNSVMKINDIDYDDITYSDFKKSKTRNLMISKIRHPFIQTTKLKLNSFNDDVFIFDINEETEKIFDLIDNKSLGQIKETLILDELELEKINYKTIVNHNDVSSIRIKSNSSTVFFIENNKKSNSLDDIKSLIKCNADVKIIISLDSIVIDIDNNIVFTNILLKQVLIYLATQTKLIDYSFIISDSDDEVELNAQTEYMKPNVCDDDEVENDVDINIFLQTISEMKTK